MLGDQGVKRRHNLIKKKITIYEIQENKRDHKFVEEGNLFCFVNHDDLNSSFK